MPVSAEASKMLDNIALARAADESPGDINSTFQQAEEIRDGLLAKGRKLSQERHGTSELTNVLMALRQNIVQAEELQPNEKRSLLNFLRDAEISGKLQTLYDRCRERVLAQGPNQAQPQNVILNDFLYELSLNHGIPDFLTRPLVHIERIMVDVSEEQGLPRNSFIPSPPELLARRKIKGGVATPGETIRVFGDTVEQVIDAITAAGVFEKMQLPEVRVQVGGTMYHPDLERHPSPPIPFTQAELREYLQAALSAIPKRSVSPLDRSFGEALGRARFRAGPNGVLLQDLPEAA